MDETTAPSGTIRINLDDLRELVNLSNRRVAAFIRFGLDGLDDRDGGDFRLDSAQIGYHYWPQEVSQEHRNEARAEFRAWLIGACLRELDQFYSLFLDRVWFAIEASELHGRAVPSDHVFDAKFSRQTNVANKQRDVSEKLGIEDHYEKLNSLGLARNSLSHHAGIVRAPTDCNDADRSVLTVSWLGYEMLAMREGHEQIIEQTPYDTSQLPGEGEITLGLRVVVRETVYRSGESISLTNREIAELCWFYRQICVSFPPRTGPVRWPREGDGEWLGNGIRTRTSSSCCVRSS